MKGKLTHILKMQERKGIACLNKNARILVKCKVAGVFLLF
jgi:DNA-directed RNA polymerase subunit RPC12/RpoP